MTTINRKTLIFSFFLMIFPLSIIGNIASAFDYTIISYLKYSRGTAYTLSFIYYIFFFQYYLTLSNHSGKKGLLIFSVANLIILIFIIQIIYHYDISGYTSIDNPDKVSSIKYNIPVIISYGAMLCIGIHYTMFLNDKGKKIAIFWFISSIFILINTNYTYWSLNFSEMQNPSDRSFTLAMSDCYAILSLSLYFYFRKLSKLSFLLYVFISILCLFFISSRTALIAFTLAITFSEILSIKSKPSNIIIFIICFFGLSLIYFYLQYTATGYSSRLFSISEEDTSISGRRNMLNIGLNAISNNIFIGDFAGQVKIAGDGLGARWGGYMHNILSFFRQGGVIVFALVVIILINSFTTLYQIVKRNLLSSLFGVILYIIVVSLFSRSYVYPWIFLLAGINISYILDSKGTQTKSTL